MNTWTPINNSQDTYYRIRLDIENVPKNDAQIWCPLESPWKNRVASGNSSKTTFKERSNIYQKHYLVPPSEC